MCRGFRHADVDVIARMGLHLIFFFVQSPYSWVNMVATGITSALHHSLSNMQIRVRILSYILCSQLARLPIKAIFVFDGDEKPSMKWGTQVINWEHFGMTLFIQAFRFEHHMVSYIDIQWLEKEMHHIFGKWLTCDFCISVHSWDFA